MSTDSWERLDNSWEGLKEVILYGYGRVAQRNMKKLSEDFDIKLIIDNNEETRKSVAQQYSIKSLEEALPILRRYKIIVTTSSLAYDSIRKQLVSIGLAENIDFCRLETFMLEWYWKYKRQICISQVLSAVTTRCTFRCKHCSNLMPYFKVHYEYTEDDIYNDLSLLFSTVDYLASYYLIGGEPLLNKRLPEIITMVCEKFSDKIGYIQIITNGGVIPSEKLLSVIKKYDIKVRVSDYTRTIPYKEKYEMVIKVLQKNNVDYSISDYSSWMNLGFPLEDVKIMIDYRKHMQNCSQGCHSVNDGKFYYCGTLWDAEKSGLYTLQEGDYLDLHKVKDKFVFLKYCLGIQDGYIGLCKKCRGFGQDNTCIVDVAEQC